MKVNNIFNALLQVKNKINDSIEKQLNLVNSLFKGMSNLDDDTDDYLALNISEQVTASDGRVYELSKHANEMILKVNNMTDSIADTISGQLSYNSTLNILPSSDGFQSIYFGDILTYICEGEVYNEAISKITDLFLISNNISVTNIGSAIDSINGPVNEDVSNLKYFASQISTDGKISSYSWLSLLNSITTDTESAISSTSVDFVSENPFVVRSFFSTVLEIANATLSLVLQTVIALMNSILSIIGL